MILSHDDTKHLIELVLDAPPKEARIRLNAALRLKEQNEAQWFELLSKLPNRILRSKFDWSFASGAVDASRG